MSFHLKQKDLWGIGHMELIFKKKRGTLRVGLNGNRWFSTPLIFNYIWIRTSFTVLGKSGTLRPSGSVFFAFICFLLPSAENLKILIDCPLSKQSIVELLTSEDLAVQRACLALLREYSEMPCGRRLAIDNFNVHTWATFFCTIHESKEMFSSNNLQLTWNLNISVLSIWSLYNILAQKL